MGLVYGGVGQRPQVDTMARGVDILVATPGRLMDLMNQGHIKLDKVSIFVLDEADRMLDMGFIRDIRRIAAKLPRRISRCCSPPPCPATSPRWRTACSTIR
jgi:Superfamily II DNA and RNA helicases